MHLVQTVAPSVEPVSLTDAKLHAYVDITATDSLVTTLVSVARQWVEQYCQISLINQTWKVTYDFRDNVMDAWFLKRAIKLPQSPISSITSVTTYDRDGNATVFDSSNYFLSNDRVVLKDTASWPTSLRLFDALQIIFVAGYGASGTNVPAGIIQAIKMLVATWYENREAINDDMLSQNTMQPLPLPFGITSLLSQFRNRFLL